MIYLVVSQDAVQKEWNGIVNMLMGAKNKKHRLWQVRQLVHAFKRNAVKIFGTLQKRHSKEMVMVLVLRQLLTGVF